MIVFLWGIFLDNLIGFLSTFYKKYINMEFEEFVYSKREKYVKF